MGSFFFPRTDKVYESIKSGYFLEINQLIKQHYESGITPKRLKNNVSICLENKYFDELYAAEDKENIEYIYWLDYLYNYLSIEVRDKEWAQEMLILLDEEQFLPENKYLSQFFFKDFYLSSEPNCIKDPKNDSSVNNDIYEDASVELRTSMNNSNLGMMRALGGTIGPNAITDDENNNDFGSINDDTDTDQKYKAYRNKVKKYIYIFKQHIVFKDHPINRVIQIFEKTWVKYTYKKTDFMKNNNISEEERSNVNLLIDALIKELQNFIIKVQICLKLFYCRAINYSCFVNEKDELMNLVTTLFFKTGNIYKVTFDMLKIKLYNEVEDMTKKYRQLYNIMPQQLGIDKQFCLNEETLSYQESILEEKLRKIDDNAKKEEKGGIEHEIDIKNKGVANIYFNDEPLDKAKIQTLLTKIRNMKKQFPKNGIHNLDNIKVDIDFDRDDNNLITESIYNKPSYLNEELLNPILPKSRETMDLELDFPAKNQPRISYNPNLGNKDNYKNNILFTDNDPGEMESLNDDKNQIIRDAADGRKTISPFNFLKVFNCVKFTKEPGKNSHIRYPYETAITLLKQIEKYKAPFEKMLIFASLGDEIKNCIDDFWKDMEGYVKSDILGVEAEQLMTIFIYIISKAQINDILVHCKLIQLFTTSVIKSSMIGYYYSNAEASVTFIQTLKNVKDLLKGKSGIFDDNNNFNDY